MAILGYTAFKKNVCTASPRRFTHHPVREVEGINYQSALIALAVAIT